MSKTCVSRRRFIKVGLSCLAGASSGLGYVNKLAGQLARGVSRTSLKTLRAIPTTCEQCPAGCGVIAYLNGDRLVQILGNPEHPHNKGGICARGVAGINLANDPERLLYPLKRRGIRGEGLWTRITWDEAYSLLTERIEMIKQKRRIGQFVIDKDVEEPLLEEFADALGIPVIDRRVLNSLNYSDAWISTTGFSSPFEDVGKSRTILNFGANPYANHSQFISIARRLILAQVEKGAKLFTFDVRMSETAAKSDAWYPIKPGTDGIVALAIARIIVANGLADKDFIEKRTDISFSSLKEHLSPYTLEFAEKESGVRAEDLETLAVYFAKEKPSLVMAGGGVFEHENGSQNVRCIALLNLLVGNLEKEGGIFFPRYFHQKEETRSLAPDLKSKTRKINGIADLYKEKTPVDAYFACFSNPAYDEPDCQSTSSLLKDEKAVPFLAVMDTHMTETAVLADLVLPAATYLEGWGLKVIPSMDMTPVLNLRQPVVSLLSDAEALRSPSFEQGKLLEPVFKPRGESKEVGNFCLELASRLGGEALESLSFRDTFDYVSKKISSIPELIKQGGLQTLREHGFWTDKLQQTKTGISKLDRKVVIYSEKRSGRPLLPEYQPIASHKNKKEGEFILTTFKTALSSRGTANSKWIQEIFHENRLWMNKQAASKLNIKNGDRVRVISSAGAIITRVLVTARIHPDSVAIAEGSGHTAVGRIAKGMPFSSPDQDSALVWWKKSGNGANPNEVIDRRQDKLAGGFALKDTVVRIEKI